MPAEPEAIIKPGDHIQHPSGDIFYWSKDGRAWYKVDEKGTLLKVPANMALMLTRSVMTENMKKEIAAEGKELAKRLNLQASPSGSALPEPSSS